MENVGFVFHSCCIGLGIVIHSKSEAGNWSLGNLFIYSNDMTFYFGSFGFLMSVQF